MRMADNHKLIDLSRSISLDQRSKYLRKLVMRAFAHSGKGHVGSAFSMMEIIRVLYDDVMAYKPDDPKWAGRDRLIISPGWSSIGLYRCCSPSASRWFC